MWETNACLSGQARKNLILTSLQPKSSNLQQTYLTQNQKKTLPLSPLDDWEGKRADLPELQNYLLANEARLPRKQQRRDGQKRNRSRVTVCIAAACQYNSQPFIVAASDYMLTAAHDTIQYEPRLQKLATLSPLSCICLYSGDANQVADILNPVRQFAQKNPSSTINDVAQECASSYQKIRRNRVEANYLNPLGLDFHTFHQDQRLLDSTLVQKLSKEMLGENSDLGIEILIAGVDISGGAQIYIIDDPGQIESRNNLGFASIGVGRVHADPIFMFEKYMRTETLYKSIFLTYVAKRAAEVAPGVGQLTDMFLITIGQQVVEVPPDIMKSHIQRPYDEMQKAINRAKDRAATKIGQWLDNKVIKKVDPEG